MPFAKSSAKSLARQIAKSKENPQLTIAEVTKKARRKDGLSGRREKLRSGLQFVQEQHRAGSEQTEHRYANRHCQIHGVLASVEMMTAQCRSINVSALIHMACIIVAL
jgi:hypothetical protein